jgi:hypothetical protein
MYMRYTIFVLASDVEEMEMKEREDTQRREPNGGIGNVYFLLPV